MKITDVDLAQETSDIDDVGRQKVVQWDHVEFLAEEDVIGQILHDLRYIH